MPASAPVHSVLTMMTVALVREATKSKRLGWPPGGAMIENRLKGNPTARDSAFEISQQTGSLPVRGRYLWEMETATEYDGLFIDTIVNTIMARMDRPAIRRVLRSMGMESRDKRHLN